MLRPRSGLGQWVVREEYTLEPSTPIVEYTDSYGNLCQRLMTPEGVFRVYTTACVETADAIDVEPDAPYLPVQNLPDTVLQFLLPSRYCEADRLGDLASEIVGDSAPGYGQVEAIRHWIHTNVTYEYGTSDASTSAIDIAKNHVGVCRILLILGLLSVAASAFQRGWWSAIFTSLTQWIYTPGLKFTWAIAALLQRVAGLPLMLPNQNHVVIGLRSPMDAMPLMLPWRPSLDHSRSTK
jgi:hypothetical protein